MEGPRKKRALVLSGGGSKGAWQAGAIKALLESGRKYDIITGISVGALNGSFLTMYADGEELLAAEDLVNLWENLHTKNVHKRWFPFGMLHGLWKPSFYNSKPLMKMVHETLDVKALQNSGKELRVGAVSLDDGLYRMWSQNDDDIADGVLASSSFPGFLTPIKMDGRLWSDGGLRNVTPLKSAIELGAEEADILMTMVSDEFEPLGKNPNALKISKRTLDVMIDEVIQGDIKQALLINDIVSTAGRFMATNKKYIYINLLRPSNKLDIDSLDFDNEKMKKLIKQGYEDGKHFIGST